MVYSWVEWVYYGWIWFYRDDNGENNWEYNGYLLGKSQFAMENWKSPFVVDLPTEKLSWLVDNTWLNMILQEDSGIIPGYWWIYPLLVTNIAIVIANMAMEITSLPINSVVIFHSLCERLPWVTMMAIIDG